MPLKFIQGMSLKKSATIVVKRLIDMCGAGQQYGRILFTDNFYTSLQLMIVLWISFKMFSVETFRITKKKARTIADFPFHNVVAPTAQDRSNYVSASFSLLCGKFQLKTF